LNDGRILIAGGGYGPTRLATAELYDPASGKFTPTGNMTSVRVGHTATLLNDGTGRVLIAGGYGSGPAVATAELYDPSTGRFTTTGSLLYSRDHPTATLLNNGKVLIVGGEGLFPDADFLSTAELYDPATGRFTATGNMVNGRSGHTATLLNNGKVV